MLENKLFEALLDVIPFGAYAVDIETFEIVYANKIVRENMYAPQETYCWEKVYGQEQICPWCSVHKQSSGTLREEDKHTCEFFDEIDDRWVKSYDEFISWPDGRNVKYSILVDTTDQKETQGSMIQSHAKLAVKTKQIHKTNQNLQITKLKLQKTVRELREQRQKAEAATRSKSEFLANMSHEIRTPMNAILGMSHLALQTNLDEKQRNYIEKIDTSSRNLLEILNDILDFSKIEAGKLSIENIDFDMPEMFARVRSVVELKAEEKGLEFNVSCDNKGHKIFFGDPLRLSQILINLASNAIKFTHDGKVEIIINMLENDKVRVSVKDTGIGLTKEQQENLFQPFTQADGTITREYGGTGLGLSITKQLVELMDGEIWIESELGIGSSFIFEIPLPKGDPSKVETRNKKDFDLTQISTLKGSHILLVEDNITNQELVTALLEESGINIDIVNNGKEALENFEKSAGKYELILMDIQMPILDGYETTKTIRKSDTNIPIIALSANVMEEDIQKALESGMNNHLTKPIEIEELYKILLKYITQKTTLLVNSFEKNETSIPDFLTLDIEKALKNLGNNKKLYIKLLNNFKKDYHNIDVSKIDENTIHIIKGLSGSIGATKLYSLTQELDRTLDKSLIPEFLRELYKVTNEIDQKLIMPKEEACEKKEMILDDMKKQLFTQLQESAELMEPKKCKATLDAINQYKLLKQDKELIDKIYSLCEEYDFDEILELLS